MKFTTNYFNKTSLYYAVERRNIEIVTLLLNHPSIDINQKYILSFLFGSFNII